MEYRPDVGTITPATAGTPGICRSQKATHRRNPHHSTIGKRIQSDLLNRINKAYPRPCQAENRAVGPHRASLYFCTCPFTFTSAGHRLNSFFPCWTLPNDVFPPPCPARLFSLWLFSCHSMRLSPAVDFRLLPACAVRTNYFWRHEPCARDRPKGLFRARPIRPSIRRLGYSRSGFPSSPNC